MSHDNPSHIHTWREGDHTLHIESWFPRSEYATIVEWHQGFVDGIRVSEGSDHTVVRARVCAEALRRPVYTDEQLGKEGQRGSPTHTAHRTPGKEPSHGNE